MTLTRSESSDAFLHVLENVLGHDKNSPLFQALVEEGFDSMLALLSIQEN